jgi:hypothetical protein
VQVTGILKRRQRILAWIAFLLLASYGPVLAWLRSGGTHPDDTWMFPVAVAAVVGYVLIVDDIYRRRAARAANPAEQARADLDTPPDP